MYVDYRSVYSQEKRNILMQLEICMLNIITYLYRKIQLYLHIINSFAQNRIQRSSTGLIWLSSSQLCLSLTLIYYCLILLLFHAILLLFCVILLVLWFLKRVVGQHKQLFVFVIQLFLHKFLNVFQVLETLFFGKSNIAAPVSDVHLLHLLPKLITFAFLILLSIGSPHNALFETKITQSLLSADLPDIPVFFDGFGHFSGYGRYFFSYLGLSIGLNWFCRLWITELLTHCLSSFT